ncbi:MAG: methylmalonyl-CoA mutase family protein, partial [Gemmatimonadaceae bacterium]
MGYLAREVTKKLIAGEFIETKKVPQVTEKVNAALLDEIVAMGDGSMLDGVHAAIEGGWFQARIAESAYAFEASVASGERIIVGVNRFTEGDDDEAIEIHEHAADVEERQIKRLAAVKEKLFTERNKRDQPFLNKIMLTGWSGLMIGGFARGAIDLKEPKYAETAAKAAVFVL